ncbi:MAG: hypothetical protein AAGJ81_08040 [Verrucomicrobiota bacterium]
MREREKNERTRHSEHFHGLAGLKILCPFLILLGSFSLATGAGWTDYTLDIGDGYEVLRANSLEVCIGKKGGGLIFYPQMYEDVGPVVGYQMNENYLLARTLGRTPRNRFEGDTLEKVDPHREFFFLIPKSTDEPVGPFTAKEFADALKEAGLKSEGWIQPRNPNFWTPFLGSLAFFAFALPFLFVKYFYISIPAVFLAIWLFRKMRIQRPTIA